MPDVTQTKRKAILREMSGHEGVVSYFRLMQLASRHQLSIIDVRNVLTQVGYQCDKQPDPAPASPAPRTEPPVRVVRPPIPLTPEEVAIIKSGKLYRALSDDSDFVIIRRAQFEMERERIIKMIAAFSP